MRYSTWLGLLTLLLVIWIGLTANDYGRRRADYQQSIWQRQKLQRLVGLTDLSITSAARYLRHYSLSDMTTPFQDYPVSLDHFPAGFVYAAPDYSGMPTPVVFGHLE